MKMINAGLSDISDYKNYSYNCNLNKCQRAYLAPVPTLADVQLFVNFGVNKPDAVEFTAIDLCGLTAPVNITTTCFKIAFNGAYWYGVFRKFKTATFPTFIIALKVDYVNGDQVTLFSEQYTTANTCDDLTKINVCYPINFNAEDANGIYVGEHVAASGYSGNADIIYQHSYWVRNSEIIEVQNKITFTANSRRTFASTLVIVDELRYEFVPGWYKNYLTAVYSRGNFFIDNIERRATDLNYENIFEDGDLWKASVKIEKEVKAAFGCATISCGPDACVCYPPAFPVFVLPDAATGGAYSFSVTLSGSSPFTIDSVIKPDWMTISVSGNILTFSGTPAPGDLGIGIVVRVIVSNECGKATTQKVITVSEFEPEPLLVVTLTRVDFNTFRANISGGVGPYSYVFNGNAVGSLCASYSFTNGSGSTASTVILTDYTSSDYADAIYSFFVNVQDSVGEVAVSNVVTEPMCLVPYTMIRTYSGLQQPLADIKKGDWLDGRNEVLSWKKFNVDKLYSMNDGLLITSEGHVNILHSGELRKSAYLKVGDELTDRNGKAVVIASIEIMEGNFEVINISTADQTYIANGILTHNKLAC